jgi:hypothetical protein
LQTPIHDFSQKIILLREIVQNRNPIPIPHGAVTTGRPQDQESLHEYSDEERSKEMQNLRDELIKHDKKIINELREVEEKIIELESPDTLELPLREKE